MKSNMEWQDDYDCIISAFDGGYKAFTKKSWDNWNVDQHLNPWTPEYESSANHYASAFDTRNEVVFYFRVLSQS
jgi:hypothetical protein